MYKHFFKRLIDLVLSIIGIIVLAIPMLIIAIIIKIDSPGPVFFRQRRIGIHKKEFMIIKFRSMPVNVPHDTPTHQFKAEDMLTKWQRLERRASLDELPQLFNVLKGDISLVGPRALVPGELRDYGDRSLLLSVKSGLTGLAQVSGRRDISFEERRALDLYYIQNWSLRLDIQILFRTIGAVLLRKGAK